MAEKRHTMERDRDEKSGRFTEQYSDEEFIEAIRATGGAASTRDVVDHVGADYDATYKRLRALEDAGMITSRKIANARLWEIAEE